MMVLTAVAGNVSMYSANVVSRVSIQGAKPARYSWRSRARPGTTGASENPQCPTTSVVTPCRILLSARGAYGSVKSECVLMSMKPGATISPCASTTRRAGPECRGVMAAIRPSRTARSARTGSAPVPSRIMPPRMTRSSMFVGPRRSAAGVYHPLR